MSFCFWLSFASLLLTKAADVVSTWRHVGVHGETNPIARPLFVRFGLAGGLAIVCAIYLVIASAQYLLVWWTASVPLIWANTVLGFLIAWVQLDVARFNMTGRPSTITRIAGSAHEWWARRRNRRGPGATP